MRRLAALLLVLLGLCGTACDIDPINLVKLGDGGLPDQRAPDTSGICEPSNDGVEACDSLDNDCDGMIDEDFNLQTNPSHCGRCDNSCQVQGGLSECELGVCRYLGCAPGFYDLNDNATDGCEYECTPQGEELCDGQDNDCNGQVDELFNLETDVANCGACGEACLLANATPRCEGGQCKVLSCDAGFINKDAADDNGCEVPCTPTNSGVEACDGLDNDCNGVVDDPGGEPIDFANDPFNCGACGVVCVLANADAACQASGCVLTGCQGDYLDADDLDENGCECLPTGVEVCDGLDNDCNGQVDDGIPPLGPCGTAEGECAPGQLLCQNGYATCVGRISPQPEICDGLDNDCNGQVDDNVPSLGGCGSDVGECRPGTLLCVNGQGSCTGDLGPQAESCDGKDNDCDGIPDNNLPDLGPCGSGVGECTPGTIVCQSGQPACQGLVGPQPETCDGLDNDCDGNPDDNLPILGICGQSQGECVPGVLVCQNGQPECTGDTPPTDELCDGLDNDCDGAVDEELQNLGTACGSSVGECEPGVLDCQGGQEVCVGSVGASAEHCDGLDTDCNGGADPAACLFAAGGRERRLDQPTLTTLGAFNSSQLAVAGVGERVLAVWLDRRSGRGDIYGNVSTDGGASWSSPDIGVATDSSNKTEPAVAFGGLTASGGRRAYVVYERFDSNSQRDIYLRRSTNGGTSWGTAVLAETEDRTGGDALFVRLAVAPGATAGAADTVVVCWERIALEGAIRPNIRCNISRDSGSTFSSDVRVNAEPDNAFVPELAIDESYVYVTWQQGTSVRAARAAHSVAPLNFTNERTLSVEAGQDPRIAVDGTGGVLVVWEDLRQPLLAIRANRSADRGVSWLVDGVRLDNDVVDGNSENPAIAVRPGGRIFVAWTDTNRGQPDIYVNFSDDGGLSWSPVQRLATADPAGAGAHASYYPVIAVAPDNNNVYVAWEDYRSGPERDIYINLSLDNGETWNIVDARLDETPAGTSDTASPRIWATAGQAAVIWLDYRAAGAGGALVTGANGDIYSSFID